MINTTEAEFLRDLAKRIRKIPVKYGTDQDDVDRLLNIVNQRGIKRFTLRWRDGTSQIIAGTSIKDAFNHAGYVWGAVAGLDHWEQVDATV